MITFGIHASEEFWSIRTIRSATFCDIAPASVMWWQTSPVSTRVHEYPEYRIDKPFGYPALCLPKPLPVQINEAPIAPKPDP